MTDLEKAARQALEALEQWNTPLYKRAYVITSLRQALEQQPAGEPVAWVTEDGDRAITHKTKMGMLRDGGAGASSVAPYCVAAYTRPQPAAPAMFGGGLVAIKTLLSRDPCAHAKVAIEMIDAMLAQPAAQWVGLTDDERVAVQYEAHKKGLTPLEFMELHEAKLREKNGGKV